MGLSPFAHGSTHGRHDIAMSACESVRMAETEQGIEDWQVSHLAASQRTHGGARGVVPASRRTGPHRHFGLCFRLALGKV